MASEVRFKKINILNEVNNRLKYLNKDINNLLGKAVVFKAPESVGNYYNTFWLKRIIASSNDFIEINNRGIK